MVTYLTKTPKRIVGLFGCSATHAHVSTLLSANAGELEGQITIQSIDSEQALTCFRKEPHQYQSYRPDGILKASWFAKHQERICSCILVLFDWGGFIDRLALETSLSVLLEKVRNLTKARNPKIMLVLFSQSAIQRITAERGGKLELTGEGFGLDVCPVPFAESVGLIRRKLDLDTKQVIFLQASNQLELSEVARRTMRTVGEYSAAYILDEAKHLKKRKNEVNKVQQPYLCVRHRFKAAWFYEMLRDLKQSLKNYHLAYEFIQAVTPDMYSPVEVRAVGELIQERIVNIKLWWEKDIRAASEFFEDHMRWYHTVNVENLGLTGSSSQMEWIQILQATDALQLNASVSSQYEKMGDSMSSFSMGNYWTVASCPGRFYFLGAEALRKQIAFHKGVRQLFEQVSSTYATTDARPQFYDSGYIGKPPVLVLKNDNGAEVELERRDIIFTFLRVFTEQQNAASGDVLLSLLNKCLESFSLLHTPRLSTLVAYQIAEVLTDRGEWARAKKYIADRIPDVAKEKWYEIAGKLLRLVTKCSAKADDQEAWFQSIFWGIAIPIASADVRSGWFSAVLKYLNEEGPTDESSIDIPAKMNGDVHLEWPGDHPFLSIKVQFSEPCVRVHSPAQLHLHLTTKCPSPVPLQQVSIAFNHSEYNVSKDATEMPMEVPQHHPITLEFPINVHEPKLLRCTEVTLCMGKAANADETSPCLRLRWTCPAEAKQQEMFEEGPMKYNFRQDAGFCDFLHRPFVHFVELQPKMTIEVTHNAPALLNEEYEVRVKLCSHADVVKSGSLTVPVTADVAVWSLGSPPTPEQQQERQQTSIPFGPIEANSSLVIPIVVRSSCAGTCSVSLEVHYSSELSQELTVSHLFQLEVVYPFDAQFVFTDTISWTKPKCPSHPAFCFPYRLPSRSTTFLEKTNNYPIPAPTPGIPLSPTQEGVVPPFMSSSIKVLPRQESSGDTMGPPSVYNFRRQQPIDFLVKLVATTPFPIIVQGMQLVPNAAQGISVLQQPEKASQLEELLQETEELDEVFCISGSQPGQLLGCGHLLVTARRASSTLPLTFTLPLPPINIIFVPLVASVECNTVAYLGEELSLKLKVRNTTAHIQGVSVQASDSRSFFWAGRASFVADVLPKQEAEFQYNLIPIQTGTVYLPPIEIQDRSGANPVLLSSDKLSIFVYPRNHPSLPML